MLGVLTIFLLIDIVIMVVCAIAFDTVPFVLILLGIGAIIYFIYIVVMMKHDEKYK